MQMTVFHKSGIICLLAGAMALPGFAQTSAPQRGHSATLRTIATRAYLGVGVVELTDDRVKALQLKEDKGLEVKHVDEGSPAERAGLKENDVILEVNGKVIEDIDQFQDTIGNSSPGTKVKLTIWRKGAKQTVDATLDQRPDNLFFLGGPDFPDAPIPPMPAIPFGNNAFPALPGNAPMVGFEGETLNPQLAGFFGVKQGVLVRSVTPKTPAEHAGLKAGDVVTKVNGTPVMTPREITGLVRASRNRKSISFTVVRDRKEIRLNVDISLLLPADSPDFGF